MWLFFASLTVHLAGALCPVLVGRRQGMANSLGAAMAMLGSILGLGSALLALSGGGYWAVSLPWAMPLGRLELALDPLSAVFLLPGTILGVVCSVYGRASLRHHPGCLAGHWGFFNLTLGATLVVLTARHVLPFLMAWEVMSVAPFFCITLNDSDARVRGAGWVYFVSGHAGAALLIALFLLLGRSAGSMDFAALTGTAAGDPTLAGVVFFLALVGFGSKAGIMPLHFWLPEAHPAAPSHISAYLSGALIKTGVYGFLRTLTFLGPPSPSWGPLLLGLGAATAVLGILYALAQSDLKRLLAYSSVENIGIVFMGVGAGLIGLSTGSSVVATLGFAAALLHVLNHCVMKGLLFLSAGAVLHAAGTVHMERLGGLLKRMPLTGLAFVVGAAAVSGLPPLNAFTGELLFYLATAVGTAGMSAGQVLALWAGAAALALTGGLAAYAMAKGFGTTFLGEPRSDMVAQAHDPSPGERMPLLALAMGCLLAALASPVLLAAVLPAVGQLAPTLSFPGSTGVVLANQALESLAMFSGGVILLGLALALVRKIMLRGKPVRTSPTWDCGYLAPTSRMQYSGSSFAAPLLELTGSLLGHRVRQIKPSGLFPGRSELATATPDRVLDQGLHPAASVLIRSLDWVKQLQHGKTNLYILYVLVTLVVLLVWRLG